MWQRNAKEPVRTERQHFNKVLLERFERSFETHGYRGVCASLQSLLDRLSDQALRDYAVSQSLTSQKDLEPEGDHGPTLVAEEDA